MKKSIYFLVASLLFSGYFSHAQELLREFGKDVKQDFMTEAPDYDPEAEAVIIFDVAETRFVDAGQGLDVKFIRTKRIKILKESGLDEADISIPLYNEKYNFREELLSLKARTYNMDGEQMSLTPLEKDQVFEEKINEYWVRKKFAMPAVKVGSVIEYSYEILSPRVFNLPNWRFQSHLPTLFSQYIVGITPFYEYTFLLQGDRNFYDQKSTDEYWRDKRFAGVEYNDRVHDFIMKDIPAFKDESYITSVEDFIIKLDFQLARIRYPTGGSKEFLTTWEDLNKDFLKEEEFGQFMKKSERVGKSIIEAELPLDGLKDIEKLQKIVNYVKASFSWDGTNYRFAEGSVKDLLREKTGSSAEINLFLTGMLKAAGLTARPVLTSTRDHGQIKVDYPYTRLFNNVLVLVTLQDVHLLTDGTEPLLAFDRIPARCLNHQGLVLDKEGQFWIDLSGSASIPSTSQHTIMLKLDGEDGMIKGEFLDQSTEYFALVDKKFYGESHDVLIGQLEKRGYEDVAVVQSLNHDNPGKPFYIKYTADYQAEQFGDKYIFSPFLDFPLSNNVLKQEQRTYPVDMNYSKKSLFSSTIMIPEGYEIVEVPADYKVDNNMVQIDLKSQVIEDMIVVQGAYHFKKPLYEVEEYKNLRYYYRQIVKKFNEKIVIKAPSETSMAE
jgi:transglutaminase-like putative cysteine protease